MTSTTEQDYLELAEDCKQRIADKNDIIETLKAQCELLSNTVEAYIQKIENLKTVVTYLLNAID